MLFLHHQSQKWIYSQKFWLLSYSAQPKMAVHCSSNQKKKFVVLTLMVRIFYFIFFFLLLSHFYPLLLSPLSPHTLHFFPLQAPIPPLTANPSPYPAPTNLFVLRPSLFLLSHFSSTLSLNLSPSQIPRPMIAGAGFWFCHHDWQNGVVAVTGFYWWVLLMGFMLMGSIFILMNGFWFCWWLMNGVCWWLMNEFCWWLNGFFLFVGHAVVGHRFVPWGSWVMLWWISPEFFYCGCVDFLG